jgi:hypothetical protein
MAFLRPSKQILGAVKEIHVDMFIFHVRPALECSESQHVKTTKESYRRRSRKARQTDVESDSTNTK